MIGVFTVVFVGAVTIEVMRRSKSKLWDKITTKTKSAFDESKEAFLGSYRTARFGAFDKD